MVCFNLDEVEVFFPYDFVYPEQYAYMRQLKKSLDAKGHCVLEMPTGTGKTVAVFSLVTSYQLVHPEIDKFYFCTRTIAEMEKALVELRSVLRYRWEELKRRDQPVKPVLAFALSARRNLCVHPIVSKEADRDRIDEKCRNLTAPWVRTQNQAAEPSADIEDIDIESCKLCPWYENLTHHWSPDFIPKDVYTIDELKRFGVSGLSPVEDDVTSNPDRYKEVGGQGSKVCSFCPYFAARRLVHAANILILNYQYVLDPKVAQVAFGGSSIYSPKGQVMADVSKTTSLAPAKASAEPSVIVFDEAHNIDNVCIEALSINITILDLEKCRRNISKLQAEVLKAKKDDQSRLLKEYQALVERTRGERTSTDPSDRDYESFLAEHLASPLLPDDQLIVETAIPGSIRKAEIFILNLHKVVYFLDNYIRQFEIVSEGPLSFLRTLELRTKIDPATLKFFYERLKTLFVALQITDLEEYMPLAKVADFCTLAGIYWKGFVIITDPYPEAPGIYDPVIQLCCLDSSLAMQPVLSRFQSVVLTSGTISPLTLYPKLLNFDPVVTQSFPMSLDRRCILPMVISKGPDQIPLSSKFELRQDVAVIQNYGRLLTEFVKVVPDGLVCFFTSYAYMEIMINKWYETGVLAEVMRYKLIMMETKDIVSTTLALDNYRRCCDSGRGAVFFSVARGKVAEGIDFDRHYGRAVILFGVPFQYTLSRVLKARLDFMRENYGVAENTFLSFDAMRQAAQCVGRVIRSKIDYGLMIFADFRYGKTDKKEKMPEWIVACMDPHHLSLSVDVAVAIARRFLLEMSQPYSMTMRSRLNEKALKRLDELSKQQSREEAVPFPVA
eukprot:Blabericola_migrator_1__13468@NODE_973_length_5857_cov_179_640933_g675_i0_p1_GENE_NODE_973_length_5857_cov_179_640933_g675_i0NODE_973_length_5857_cov_179_640933_g675_i0_p1_ORF_typecomplete_len839_score174_65Helicase_C_2/PF13307_6/9e48DEAD_2/PF06733_15/3_2e31HBB/PF06777_11/1_7e19HBB/PF06777_11/2e06HBB/PF06777_11/2_6e03ResIII/PF04851_15/1_8e10DEAD/PF00270_29/0_22DEAD/PF00270_29/2_5e02RVT_N/PF13655_6/0_065PhoH/PF02562_16/0_24PhoH/PF02562_16/8_5e03PhoH/PF02562_16/8_2e02AAA_22/PF13401_6/24AAA_22/PF13